MMGEVASLGAALIWSGSMTTFSAQGKGLPAEALNLFKNLIALSCFGVAWVLVQPPLPAADRTLVLLAVSGIVGISLGDTALFAALQRLGAQVTSASQCLAPPIAALAAALSLGETLTRGEALGLVITATAVAGVIHFGRRGDATLSGLSRRTLAAGIFYAVLAAGCQAVGLVISRHALQVTDVLSGTMARIAPALLLLFVVTLCGPALGILRQAELPRRRLFWLALASFAGTFLGLLLMSVGVKYAKAGVAAALTSTYPVWIILIARFVLKEPVNWQTVACTLGAVGGIALLLGGIA